MTGSESIKRLRMGKCCIYPFGSPCKCLCIREIIIKRFFFRYTDNSQFIILILFVVPKVPVATGAAWVGAFASVYEWEYALLGVSADGTG